MSNQIPIVDATTIRDEEELEGALLPPTETYGSDGQRVPLAAAAAYPVEHFEYTDAALEHDQQQQEEDEHIAYPLEFAAHSGIADDSRDRVKFAERHGLVASDQELEAIRRNNGKVLSHDFLERQTFEQGNRNARFIDSYYERQGRTPPMTENRPPSKEFLCSKQEKKDSTTPSEPSTSAPYKVGGYEVKEYKMGEYDTQEYNVSEYKSVYD
eukprot:scaffold1869_cov122-Cylindrotheca_fusiformis.AAC.17